MFFNIHYFIVYVFISLSIDCLIFFKFYLKLLAKRSISV